MSKFKVIAWDVYKKNVKSTAFLVMILVPFILTGGIMLLGKFAGGFDETSKVGVIVEDTTTAASIQQMNSEDYTFEILSSEKAAQEKLGAEEIDAYLTIDNQDNTVSGVMYSESSLGLSTEMAIQQFLGLLQASERAAAFGLTAEQVAQLGAPANFETEKVDFNDAGEMAIGEDNTMVQQIVSYAATILLFLIIFSYAQIIAQEIAAEKGTRIMEVVLSSAKAQAHYYGKIFGVLMVAVTQLIIYAIIFAFGYKQITNMAMIKPYLEGISLEKLFGSYLVFTIILLVLGITIFSVLAALCGSLVNKAEDTPKAILPVTYLAMAGYFISLFMGMANPNSGILRVTSYIPFLSSFTMPVRLANETASTGAALVSIAILVVSTLALMLFSGKLYKSNVLVYNENGLLTSLKQSISILQNERKKK
ncbi:ABC-2 type transport system permease protein [Enterococcus sp. PF1-24]|uniref:ABC transporter permease n=1 Tax=unclassified Enterococcus TaxID=2608891 RepID=UPI0024763D80|nr:MULTISPECIES: ABC transporter permease [unclassified Enterococcus]MDH6363299.1 ABC-2 type transport system permease protein [Enterococcus sp. PFB1-1]MDH6400400.1 ABC-2 type transport system permease protein [Enterococcus sp. PF1-24]